MQPKPRRAVDPRKRPSQERSRATVAAILDAAARVFAESGYEMGTRGADGSAAAERQVREITVLLTGYLAGQRTRARRRPTGAPERRRRRVYRSKPVW